MWKEGERGREQSTKGAEQPNELNAINKEEKTVAKKANRSRFRTQMPRRAFVADGIPPPKNRLWGWGSDDFSGAPEPTP